MVIVRGLIIFTSIVWLGTSLGSADDPKSKASKVDQLDKLSGEITLEDVGVERRSPYQAAQDAAIAYFKKLSELELQLAQGGSGRAETISDNAMIHLTNVYLYCAVKFATCPLVLDSILEADVINAKLDKSTACPNLERFWKMWVKGDMEKRHKYLVRTATMNATNDFNLKIRPRYIKCGGLITEELTGGGSDSAFFTERYGEDSPKKNNLRKITALLQELKLKLPNLVAAAEALK